MKAIAKVVEPKPIEFGTMSDGKPFLLPADAATQTLAFIARRGAGKTYACGKLVEGMIAAGMQVVILDSVGNWWGLRLAANGRDAGIDIPILGGLRGDIPLNPEAGALIADIIVDSGKSLVLDISQFSKADRQRFATALGVRLWHRKKAQHSPTPLHLVIEESQLIVPEQVGKDQTAMVGIYEEIIRLGRNYGIGASLISQRPQSVNKEVLNQTECLVVLQVNGAHERAALRQWIVYQGLDAKIVNELPAMDIGTAYVWSPQWMKVLEKVKVGKKWTLDSTSTPKAGQSRPGGAVKPIDLKDLHEKMGAAVKEAEANDPKRLRARIGELERQIVGLGKREQELGGFTPSDIGKMVDHEAGKRTAPLAIRINELCEWGRAADLCLKRVHEALEMGTIIRPRFTPEPSPSEISVAASPAPRMFFLNEAHTTTVPKIPPRRVPQPNRVGSHGPGIPIGTHGNTSLPKPYLAILKSLMWWKSIAIEAPSVHQTAFVAGYKSSGTFDTYLSRMGSEGLLVREQGTVRITESGERVAPAVDIPRHIDDYHQRLLELLDGPLRKIVNAWLNAYEKHGSTDCAVTVANLAELSEYRPSGTFDTYLSRLGSAGLLVRKNGVVTATKALLPDGLV